MGSSPKKKESPAGRTARILGERKSSGDAAALIAQGNYLRKARQKPILDVTPAATGGTNRLGVQ